MSLTIINSKKQKRNPVAEMITAAKDHYAKFNRYIDTVTLEPIRWSIFKTYMQHLLDGQDIEIRDEIHFVDIKVKKGSKFMTKTMEIKLKASTLDKQIATA